MENFNFHNPVEIIFGKGKVRCLSKHVPLSSRVLFLYGRNSIKENGVYIRVHEALKNHTVFEMGGIEANPDIATLTQAIEMARAESIDFLLGVGGGSILDATKFVAAAVPFAGKDPWDLMTGAATPSEALPWGAVLTLPATGSEMNPHAVISRRATQEKLALSHPLLYPRFSILDPDVTASLPRHQIANGIIDAFVHTAEQYLTKPVNAPVQDRFAEALFITIREEGAQTYRDPGNYASRANFMWAATLALNGLIGCGVPTDWATHTLGHEITALTGLDHARSLAVVLPALLKVKIVSREAKLARFARQVLNVTEGTQRLQAEATIASIRKFFESFGVSTHLSGHDIDPTIGDEIIARLTRRGAFPLGALDDVSESDARNILVEAGTIPAPV